MKATVKNVGKLILADSICPVISEKIVDCLGDTLNDVVDMMDLPRSQNLSLTSAVLEILDRSDKGDYNFDDILTGLSEKARKAALLFGYWSVFGGTCKCEDKVNESFIDFIGLFVDYDKIVSLIDKEENFKKTWELAKSQGIMRENEEDFFKCIMGLFVAREYIKESVAVSKHLRGLK